MTKKKPCLFYQTRFDLTIKDLEIKVPGSFRTNAIEKQYLVPQGTFQQSFLKLNFFFFDEKNIFPL